MPVNDETTARLFQAVAFCTCGAFLRVHQGAGGKAADRAAAEFHARHQALADIDGGRHQPCGADECRRARRQAEDRRPARIIGVPEDGPVHDPETIDRELPR